MPELSTTTSEGPVLGLSAGLDEVPLTAVMELIHSTRQTGQLRVQAELPGGPLPLRLEFVGGELVGCALHDWHGPEALYAFPQTVTTGRAEFWQMRVSAAARWPLAPFGQLMGEWARLSDEWPRAVEVIVSPSQRFWGQAAPFNRQGGASARWVAANTGQSLFEVCIQMADLHAAHMIHPIRESFEWDLLILPPCEDAQAKRRSAVLRLLDGQKPLSRLLGRGLSSEQVRAELLRELGQDGGFPGAGRVIRDWLWEAAALEQATSLA
ncbi:DUF4388 domain-containing protein [Deinococcus radiophilus]|uniref:DUF4388 domain-containing protein n=1 Tax=Deinococcus radiophilus TaxID=32062 RepID=A0A3S0RIX4_9DEIO|nr:DUF4388 domain-containing protein [Deinococcus radiophilus]RTR29413.1 DUF4388 domain-containing protein [Deinococcus radiophilus]UFA50759.1 DUF4388 domain-containing protein [Deinococcus radiophilus]